MAAFFFLLLGLIYTQGFGNGFVFDDDRLFDGTVVNGYGEAAAFNWRRWLSYSSFLWFGLSESSWALQRGVNLALHALVAVSLYALWVQLLSQLAKPDAVNEAVQAQRVRMATVVAVAVFALNPVAVYAVAYLIQRSIVMATLFSVLALACMVRGLTQRQWLWHVPALLAYVLAVMSKEHAIMLPLAALVLAVFVVRPSAKQMAVLGGAGAVVLLVGVWLMWAKLGHLVGAAAFDEASGTYLQQLNTLYPGFAEQAYGLSLMNQAALFFKYGALWLVPNPQWLAIDLRPVFPVAFSQMPQLVGALAFVALGLTCVWALFARRGAWSLAAACVLGAQVLFVTEFATTWLQDPFVLYRSYIWALFVPGLLGLGLLAVFSSPKAMGGLGLVLALVLAALSFERIQSFRTAELVWADAAAKVDLNAPVSAVGRWRPVLNQGAEQLNRSNWEEAARKFELAESLGEPFGTAAMNLGVALQNMGQHAKALDALKKAQAKGMQHEMLAYHLAVSQRATGDVGSALANFEKAASQTADRTLKLKMMQEWGDTAIAARLPDRADAAFDAMLALDAGNVRAEAGKGMALLARQQPDRALARFDALLARDNNSVGHYGRALALMMQKDNAAALMAVRQALALEPNNPRYVAFAQHLQRVGAAR